MFKDICSKISHLRGSLKPDTRKITRLLPKLRAVEAEQNQARLRREADLGDPDAQVSLGQLCFYGRDGVAQDYQQAIIWFQKAASQGDIWAQLHLGRLYETGRGVLQDFFEAIHYYELAAAQGDLNAQWNLALIYSEAGGRPVDLIEAHKWFNIVGSQIPPDNFDMRDEVVAARDKLAANMTPHEVAEAQRLAREWMGSHHRPRLHIAVAGAA